MQLSIFLLVFFFFTSPISSHTSHFIKSFPHHRKPQPQQYIEVTHPLPYGRFTPSCSLPVLSHHFVNTYGLPPVSAPYSPPPDCPWSHAVLEFSASCRGEQYDRVAGVWLSGAEILRTSTAEPTNDGIFWVVRKDVTRYYSLLAQSDLTLSVMLENIVNGVYTGIYHINITFFYYQLDGLRVPLIRIPHHQKLNKKLGLVDDRVVDSKLGTETEKCMENPISMCNLNADSVYNPRNSLNLSEKLADLIIPISAKEGGELWFRIEGGSEVHSREVRIPRNTFRAVLEVYVSFHGDDEFWYSNPPDSYMKANNLTTGRRHGTFREVLVMIDGNLVGSVIPFPVIFTGGINPLFWEPVVAIGAFDLPSYEFDLTPFLGIIVDGKVHSFGLGVADGISFWLIDANLHLWLDHGSSKVNAAVVNYQAPSLVIQRYSAFKQLDGSFKIKAKRTGKFSGWVFSSAGNLTTNVTQVFTFNSLVKFHENGTRKLVKQNVKAKTKVIVGSDDGTLNDHLITIKRYPLSMITCTLPADEKDAYLMITNVSHALREKSSDGHLSMKLNNIQKSGGWMSVKGHAVLSGSTNTHQIYNYRDDFGSYSRIVTATNGKLVNDTVSLGYASSS